MGVGLATAVDVGVIVMLTGGCAIRLEIGSAVQRRFDSDEACSLVGKTNERSAPPENGAPITAEAEPGVDECGEGIGMSGRVVCWGVRELEALAED